MTLARSAGEGSEVLEGGQAADERGDDPCADQEPLGVRQPHTHSPYAVQLTHSRCGIKHADSPRAIQPTATATAAATATATATATAGNPPAAAGVGSSLVRHKHGHQPGAYTRPLFSST